MAERMETDDLNLMSISDEIFPKIFQHLNDTDLLTATRVCKRFRVIAIEAFTTKYNGENDDKYYSVIVYTDDATQEPKPYWPFFNTFGHRMTSLKLNLHVDFMNCSVIVRNHWLIHTIEQKCNSLRKLKVTLNGEEAPISVTGLIPIFSKLTQLSLHKLRMKNSKWALNVYPSLTRFHAVKVKGFLPSDLDTLIKNHPQLQHLAIVRCDKIGLKVLEKMQNTATELRALDLITFDGSFTSELEAIKMRKLESLKISLGHGTIVSILTAISKGCENLRNLEVMPVKMDYKCEIRGDIIDVICSFKQLRRVDIFGRRMEMKLLKILVRRLSNLVAIRIQNADEQFDLTDEHILKLFTLGQNLRDVTIHVHTTGHTNGVIKSLSFDLNFFNRFVDAVKNRRTAKFTFDQYEKIVVTKEKITKDGQLVHWIGFDSDRNCSILNLTNKCFQKIFSFLNGESHRALYETCTRLRKEVREKISQQLFQIDMNNLPLAEGVLQRFSDDIKRASILAPSSPRDKRKQFWNALMAKCGKQLIELHVQKMQACLMKGYSLSFPNLVKLVLEDIQSVDYNVFTMFNCPKLTHLEMCEHYIENPFISNEQLSEVDIFNNLRSIKLDRVDDCMEHVFNGMNEVACGRVKEFTVGGYEDRSKSDDLMHMMLINVISRFRNLTTLNLIVAYMENMNIKHLFENCTKIVKLSVAFESDFDFSNAQRMFECVRKNCKQIAVIQLIQRAFITDSDDGIEFDNDKQFDEKFLKMVYDCFPNAVISIVFVGYDGECLKERRITNNWINTTKRPL
ncbi:uncharacterized protein LOC116344861 [Contarinia nasturtii]|uniref:uncharacterized protein LOC116344861 n=1 Tax=Contarinia nasturtii TaxID=265458 RepID=UPI0012D4193A|nr:uncharacterized protein LOC116344861 [Contarinia nasturtii]